MIQTLKKQNLVLQNRLKDLEKSARLKTVEKKELGAGYESGVEQRQYDSEEVDAKASLRHRRSIARRKVDNNTDPNEDQPYSEKE